MQDEIDISARKQQRADKDASQKFDAIERDENLRFVMSTARGRSFMWRLLADCGVYQTSMTGNSQTFFNEGKRQVGLQLLGQMVAACPDAYMTMQKEQIHG